MREVRDGEGIGRGECGHPRGVGDLLIGDDSRNGSVHFHQSGGMLRIGAKNTEVLGGCLDIHQGVVLGVLGDFEGALGMRASVIQQLLPIQLNLGQLFVLDGLAVIRVSTRDIRTSDFE